LIGLIGIAFSRFAPADHPDPCDAHSCALTPSNSLQELQELIPL
jgi:hypothetical protein